MNVLTRRCGCGAVFALVHLKDRSRQCTACQRKEAARMERARGEATLEAMRQYARALDRAQRKKAAQGAMWLCVGDVEQVGHCEMPLRTALEQRLAAHHLRSVCPCP